MALSTFQPAASADDQSVSKTSGTYPPSGSVTRTTTSTAVVARTFSGVDHTVTNILLRFNSSALLDATPINSATLRLYVSTRSNANSRNLVGEWYTWDGTSDTDHTATPSSTAFSVSLASLTTGAYNDITLTTPTNVSSTGTTYLRLHIDGGQPSGANDVTIRTFDLGSNLPQLVVDQGATVGATLSGAFFTYRNAGVGPFKSSGGKYYFVGRTVGPTLGGAVVVFHTTDPIGGTWTASSGWGVSTGYEALAAYQVGDNLHIVAQAANGSVRYRVFQMDTDGWTAATSQEAVAASAVAPTTGATFVSLVVRSTGEVVLVYNAGQTAMSSSLNMCRYIRRTTAGTWTGATNIDNGGSINWTGPVAALGASDRVHFFFYDATNDDAYQRTLSAANVLQTFPASYYTSVGSAMGATLYHTPPAIAFDDGAARRVRAGLQYNFNSYGLASLDSADAPSVSAEQIHTGNDKVVNLQSIATLTNDGTSLHALWADNTTHDLMHDSSTGGGGAWGADTNELPGTINAISTPPASYTRSGNTVLPMVVDDGGVIKYVEVPLSAPDTTAPTVPANVTATSVAAPVVTWDASTDAVGVTQYNIKRATSSGGTYTTIDTVTGTPPATTYTDTSATPGATYFYKVSAQDAATNVSADSTASNQVNVPSTQPIKLVGMIGIRGEA
jgi:hypothetical protein